METVITQLGLKVARKIELYDLIRPVSRARARALFFNILHLILERSADDIALVRASNAFGS